MTDAPLIWGRSERSSRVHLFLNGNRQCISSRGTQMPATDIFPEWDQGDPLTCRKCRERYQWLMKGAVPAPTTRTTPTAQKA